MKPSSEQLPELIARNYTTRLDENHWHQFLRQYHYNQRIAATSSSSASDFFENLQSFFSRRKPLRWASIAGIAYASACYVFSLFPSKTKPDEDSHTQVRHEIIPTSQSSISPPDQTQAQARLNKF